MKKKILTILPLIIAIFITSAIATAFSPKKNLKPSEYKLGVSYESAMTQKKPFIAIFYSDMCSYCVQSMPKYIALADIYKDKYNFVMINTDIQSNVPLINDYLISGLPSMYIVDPSIDNRIFINGVILGDLNLLRVEFDRYLRIRAMIK